MTNFTFEIPGEPAGKARARAGNGHHYTPEQTVRYENLVKLLARPCMAGMAPHEGGATVEIMAHFSMPKSMSKKHRERVTQGLWTPKKKPDADNIAKIVCDAMNGIVYRDDSQVVDLRIRKKYAETPSVVVTVYLHD